MDEKQTVLLFILILILVDILSIVLFMFTRVCVGHKLKTRYIYLFVMIPTFSILFLVINTPTVFKYLLYSGCIFNCLFIMIMVILIDKFWTSLRSYSSYNSQRYRHPQQNKHGQPPSIIAGIVATDMKNITNAIVKLYKTGDTSIEIIEDYKKECETLEISLLCSIRGDDFTQLKTSLSGEGYTVTIKNKDDPYMTTVPIDPEIRSGNYVSDSFFKDFVVCKNL
jgi:hypothetical protein